MTASFRVAVVTALALAAVHLPALANDFVPEQVFSGRTTGEGTLDLLFGKPRPLTVESMGRLRPDGVFVLEQTIDIAGRPTEARTWRMRQTGPSKYSATLSDAAGPVEARVDGATMTLRYPLTRWGLSMHQRLKLADDGRTVANRGRIKFFGVPVGELRETIWLQPE
ncbi:DUF3833 family protein [Cognatilysobacter bugurensis]|uniref:DUF3833 family protein n=1 Tax=Cognatilysobacter bugurensis TaxID=543356 RepID=A0A918SVE1_9GAMM|nr:DUF3833 family protein [Lysobacter bugurensis]GHA72739.1 hypothetical protein GCM10007067_06630 [Lysobacter bugurensis]